MIFWLVFKLEISYNILKDFGFVQTTFLEDYIFAMVKYLSFHNSSFALRYYFNVNGKGHSVTDTPLVLKSFNGFVTTNVGLVYKLGS